MITNEFLDSLKLITESRWSESELNQNIYGFQFQRGTRWNTGLDEDAIRQFEATAGVFFPDDFKMFLRRMNGTDLPTINIYGNCGEPHRHSVGVYVYPRDLEQVITMMHVVDESLDELRVTLREEGLEIPEQSRFLPIYSHRYLLCSQDPAVSTIVSIWTASDAVVYGSSLAEYLKNEFLTKRA